MMTQIAMDPTDPHMDEAACPAVQELVRQKLSENSAYEAWFRDVSFQHARGVLTLRGRVSSFYKKQILQTVLRKIHGVELIDNQTEVVAGFDGWTL